ncbi:hypothetical protein ONA70_21325 [Micromonospora yasonensis]|uniref:hypothetical protein n=1 Tax=Micromonospora yasonensis TaxID=1128667 RepID=UPI002231361C|nr:hypothetical protein [Micromonospora yasonensis]MCW3842645.1 hypothetical protein [Micromonospora yasonensis]
MAAHLQQATEHGVDVIWWTDHDFRMQAHGYRQAVRFEGLSEPEAGRSWTWNKILEGKPDLAVGTFVSEPHSPDEPGKALRLQAQAETSAWGAVLYEGVAWNSTYTTSLAATVLELDVLAEELGPDAELLVRVLSSYRPASAGRRAGRYTLEYRIGQGTGRWTENDGLLGVVGLAVPPGTWQRLRLDLESDVAALWPDIVAADSGIHRLRVGIRSRNGAPASGVVDRLRFLRSRRDGDESVALQDEMMREYARRYPAVRQFHGTEISLVRHLNAFGGNFTLPDYGDTPPTKITTVEAAVAMVDFVHANNGLVAFNHPLEDAPSGPQLARLLIETNALGADLIEVGSKEDFGESVFGYDAAARNAVFVTATGVSDDHSGSDWVGQKQRWITSVWADSTEEADLFAALRAGRAWFWDPQHWRGHLDILVNGVVPMGGVLVTPAAQVPVAISVTELPDGATVHLVTGEVDYAGVADPAPATTSQQIDVDRPQGQGQMVLPTRTSRYLRLEVRNADGAVIGFSNPVWILKEQPRHGIPAERRGGFGWAW